MYGATAANERRIITRKRSTEINEKRTDEEEPCPVHGRRRRKRTEPEFEFIHARGVSLLGDTQDLPWTCSRAARNVVKLPRNSALDVPTTEVSFDKLYAIIRRRA